MRKVKEPSPTHRQPRKRTPSRGQCVGYPCDSRSAEALSTFSTSSSSHAWGMGTLSGQESVSKQDRAACERGHRAKCSAPWRAPCIQIAARVFFEGDAKAVSIQCAALSDVTVDGTKTRNEQDLCARARHVPCAPPFLRCDSPDMRALLIASRTFALNATRNPFQALAQGRAKHVSRH
jgi:hypothetical protein